MDLTLPSVLNLNIENLCTPATIHPNSIGFLAIPAGFASEFPTNSHKIFTTNYTLTGRMNIGSTNVIIQSTNGTVNPPTSPNAATVARLITNGANINLSWLQPTPLYFLFAATGHNVVAHKCDFDLADEFSCFQFGICN